MSDTPPVPVDPRLLEILVCPLTKGPLEYDRARNELVSRITFGVGVAATGFAAYLWYKEIRAAKIVSTASASKFRTRLSSSGTCFRRYIPVLQGS